MSIIKEAIAPCSKCSQEQKVKVYRSINIAEDPDLKEKVKNGSLFLWECPHCGQVNLAKYDTLYHDPEQKLMVWLFPDGQVSETQMQAIAFHAKAMGGYTLRIVDNMGALMEKVLIKDAGLDDAVLEMCKYVVKVEMANKIEDKEAAKAFVAAPFHFYKQEGEGEDSFITFMYPKDGSMTGLNIGYNVYQDCEGILSRNPQMKPADGFVKIDADWLNSKLA
jgi:hypothetical protein